MYVLFSFTFAKITHKILANFASLNSSIAFGDLRLGGCLRGRMFGVISTGGGHEVSMFSPSRDEYGKGL